MNTPHTKRIPNLEAVRLVLVLSEDTGDSSWIIGLSINCYSLVHQLRWAGIVVRRSIGTHILIVVAVHEATSGRCIVVDDTAYAERIHIAVAARPLAIHLGLLVVLLGQHIAEPIASHADPIVVRGIQIVAVQRTQSASVRPIRQRWQQRGIQCIHIQR